MLGKFYDMFMELDATMIEVNPLAETPEGDGVCSLPAPARR